MKKIIVADDDFQLRDLYLDLFRSAGFEVIAADDGQDAWEKAQKEYPDMVFTGIMMPRMTGFELIDKLRNNKATAPVPVIIFSHLGREQDKQMAQTLSNVQFKVKGYDTPADILKSARDLLDKSGRTYVNSPDSGEDDDRSSAAML